MLSKLFPHIKQKPVTEKVQSREAFIYLSRTMWLFGWTEADNKRWTRVYNLWTLFMVIFIMILLPITMIVEYVHRFRSFSANEFLSSFEILINMIGSSLKSAIVLKGHKKIQASKILLDKLDERCLSDKEKFKVHRYMAICNALFILYFIMYTGYVIINFMGYLVLGRHAWRMYIPLLNSDENFLMSSGAEFLLMTIAVVMDGSTDVCALSTMLMARCHLMLLKDRLENLRTDPDKDDDEHLIDLTKCIQDHRLILDYVNAMRPVLSATIFVQFLLIGIVLGMSMINIMFFSSFWTGLGTFIFMFDVCMETFPFCYLCNVIIDDCQELSDRLFQSNWMGADRRYKSTLIYFLHNLQHPITLTAGGVFPICMQTNLAMVKLAFSVVTVMKQFNLAEKFQ
ncbi:odorant receptor 22a-like [Drosophila serrata]|uniref:odorant receptor 22a-like n=1 Tax=Drosophila serrata TaxID=7274 RepID=UPI000A1D1E53|nr:odorant receptor 22a-like [Drosophila serrata]